MFARRRNGALTAIDELAGELLSDALRVGIGADLDEESAEKQPLAIVQSSDSDARRGKADRFSDEKILRDDQQ